MSPQPFQSDAKKLSDGDTHTHKEPSSIAEGVPETHLVVTEAEKRVIRKLDIHIVPLIMVLYLLSFMDRVNIGNARLYGLEDDLGLSTNQYQLCVSILFVTYVICELPSNLVLKTMKPSRWLAFLAVGWGLVATFMGFCQSFGSMIACRLLLGAVEAGLFPGLVVYLTVFYTKKEIALRMAYLFVSAALAGGCGGLFAFAIGHMDGLCGLRGWRWIMIIEGIPSVLAGIACWFLMADDPEHCTYLNDEDRAVLIAKRNRQPGFSTSGLEMHKKDVVAAFKDWKVWAMCLAHFGGDTMLWGYSSFLPTIIHSLGTWTPAHVQALTIPCYAAGAISYLIVAYLSDRTQVRSLFATGACLTSIAGYALLLSPVPEGVHYFGCILVALGLYSAVGIPIAWLPTNYPRYGTRVTASGLQMTMGNAAGISAPFLFQTAAGPRYYTGFGTTLGLLVWAAVIYSTMGFVFARINKQRDAIGESLHESTAQEMAELGDKSVHFRYTV
ncbi:putative transporter [Exophiala dermatitidis]|uniref:Retrograde regulation protein 2 n=1 Tax=Exophiala dermatitidis (strain ATCC 34100 / CBS 525.76 / NIH/UT8656) TaxID=858893 RepID=H6BUX6_EXODN|nr:retrograde regulation protein 2 [Exophiala dermatitidis NIH/UT8656]EHY54946.1 retrograde regulation protein 2 [Exophiala dermatitidis NIH/UT8656]